MLSLQKAAGMEPDNLHILGFATVVQTRDAMVKTRQPDGVPLRLDVFPQDVRGRIQDAIDRLEEGALNPDNHQAATALVWLGQLNYILGEQFKAEDQLRRAIKLHPSQDFARQWLLAVLLSSGKMSESAALIRDQLTFKDDLGLRLLLAKTLVRMGQMDDARAELESALRMSPDDFTANLAMASFLMRTQDNAEALLRAARCLESAGKTTSPSDHQAIEYEMLAGINLALRRETIKARERFNRVLQRIPYHPEALAALRAIGP
jgi:tetratricopeptide (TPR) repeat protein